MGYPAWNVLVDKWKSDHGLLDHGIGQVLMHLTSLAEAGLELVTEWHPLKFELLRKASGSSPVNIGIDLQCVLVKSNAMADAHAR
ncbi:hypothetical protein D3C71_1579100 [compost metagenome]